MTYKERLSVKSFKLVGSVGQPKIVSGDYYQYPVLNWDQYLAVSRIYFETDYNKPRAVPEKSMVDFDLLKTVGTGSYGRVVLVKGIFDGNFYAMKIISKERVVATKQVEHTFNEKRVLGSLRFPFIVHMSFFFKDSTNLYFVMPFIHGGEMFSYLRKIEKFDERLTRFYSAQVILSLEYMHYNNLIYRDLKPENILIDREGYLKITDFGFCKQINGRTYTLCGTPEYLAPEVIGNRGYGFSADWWSLGILLYEMAAGYPPFWAEEPINIYEKIIQGKFSMAKHFSDDLRDLLRKIIITDPTKRLGNLKRGVHDIKNHIFYHDINWLDILNRRVTPAYVPKIRSLGDASNFDSYPEKSIAIGYRDKYSDLFSEF